MSQDIRVRRIYEPPAADDGFRVLVDRLWPRGVTKEEAKLDAWLRELGPSTELRRWYGHQVARWPEFVQRYEAEIAEPKGEELMERIEREAHKGSVTILCAAKDAEHSNAAVVAAVLKGRLAA